MGKSLGLTLRLGPRPHDAQGTPCLPMRKIVASHTDWTIFSCPYQIKKNPHDGSHMRGAHLNADDEDQKISTHATYTAAEMPLAGSTTTRSNFQSNTNVQRFSAPNERNRANLKCV